jgi:epsilon-lactone hydrolase
MCTFLRSSGILRRRFAGGDKAPAIIAKAQASRDEVPRSKHLDIAHTEFQGRKVWTIKPRGRAPAAHLLYWHGGGYVFPITSEHWAFLCQMALEHGWSITAPLYPLAPTALASDITGWALAYYRHHMADPPKGAPVIMGGDSAGGGLTASTALLARDAGLKQTDALLLICPWLEVKPEHPDQSIIEPRDGILTINGIRDCGLMFAGELPLDDPRVSPLHGVWQGLPPILAFGGGDDILVTDARALKAKLPSMKYEEVAKMPHVFPIFRFPESRKAQAQMAEFMKFN